MLPDTNSALQFELGLTSHISGKVRPMHLCTLSVKAEHKMDNQIVTGYIAQMPLSVPRTFGHDYSETTGNTCQITAADNVRLLETRTRQDANRCD